MKDNRLNFFNYFFYLILIFLLLEGFYFFFHYRISFYIEFIDFKPTSGINPFIWNENGLVENLQIFLVFIAIINFVLIIKKKTILITSKFFIIFIYFYFFGIIYYFFEEISWGQHFFQWESPNFFYNFNKQKETNLHNISNLFNEIPRALLMLWCSFPFIFVKIFQKNKNLNLFILPDKNLKKISYIILLFVIPDLFLKKLNLYIDWPMGMSYPLNEIKIYEVVNLITFNFVKLSEFHELLFAYYILSHSYYAKKLNFIKNSS